MVPLRGANLRGADLYGADLYDADLRGADLYVPMMPTCVVPTWKNYQKTILISAVETFYSFLAVLRMKYQVLEKHS
jgi:hypothetical protein